MGAPMAGHLVKAGHKVRLHSRSGAPKALVAEGCQACADPAEVARSSEIVILMVPDTPDVERALFGEKGVASGLSAGKIVVDMSSIVSGVAATGGI
jgi:2-hydroxy-3-oxopropionate reductase